MHRRDQYVCVCPSKPTAIQDGVVLDNNRCSVPDRHAPYFFFDYMHSVDAGHYTGPSRLLRLLTEDNQEYIRDNSSVSLAYCNNGY